MYWLGNVSMRCGALPVSRSESSLISCSCCRLCKSVWCHCGEVVNLKGKGACNDYGGMHQDHAMCMHLVYHLGSTPKVMACQLMLSFG